MGRLILLLALLAPPPLATPAQFDKAGRDAFTALRAFQVEELRAWHASERWVPLEIHRGITARLAIAGEGITDSLILGADLAAGQPASPQALSLVRNVGRAVAELNGMVGPLASKRARQQMTRLQEKFAALFALFPPPPAKN